jgi:hypothetical protein
MRDLFRAARVLLLDMASMVLFLVVIGRRRSERLEPRDQGLGATRTTQAQ